MKSSTIILVLILTFTATAGAIITIDDAYADDSAESYRIWGSSKAEKGSMILAIEPGARIIFPLVTWSLWLADSAHVTLTTPNGVLIDGTLPAGIHDFTEAYEPGAISVIWISQLHKEQSRPTLHLQRELVCHQTWSSFFPNTPRLLRLQPKQEDITC